MKRQKVYDDDPLAYAVRAYVEVQSKDRLVDYLRRFGRATEEQIQHMEVYELRALIFKIMMMNPRQDIERALKVAHRPQIQKIDPDGFTTDVALLLRVARNASVRSLLDMLKSVPFLSRYEQTHSDYLWRPVFEQNFAPYTDVMDVESVTARPHRWRILTLWMEWAQKKMMRYIQQSLLQRVRVVGDDEFDIVGKRVHVGVFALLHGFYKGRLLAFQRSVNVPDNFTDFSHYMGLLTLKGMHAQCVSGADFPVQGHPTDITVFSRIVQVCAEYQSLGQSQLLNTMPDFPVEDRDRHERQPIFLGESACAECGTSEAKQWFSCTDCAARVCASQECERTHLRQFH